MIPALGALWAHKKLIGIGLLAVVIGGMYLRMHLAVSAKERAEVLVTKMEQDLAYSEQQNAALAHRFVEEVQAHHDARERERRIANDRRRAADAARLEHERITDEILASLSSEACTAVPVPVAAVDGLRDYAAFANNLRDRPGESVPADSLRLE